MWGKGLKIVCWLVQLRCQSINKNPRLLQLRGYIHLIYLSYYFLQDNFCPLFPRWPPKISAQHRSWSATRQAGCRYNSHVKFSTVSAIEEHGLRGQTWFWKNGALSRPTSNPSTFVFWLKELQYLYPKSLRSGRKSTGHISCLPNGFKDNPWVKSDPPCPQRTKNASQSRPLTIWCSFASFTRTEWKAYYVGGQPLYSVFLFPNGYGIGHGPLSSDDELWAEMSLALSKVPEEIRLELRRRMPSAAPYTFTHADLTNVDIILDNGNLAGILDWELFGLLSCLVGVYLRRNWSRARGQRMEGFTSHASAGSYRDPQFLVGFLRFAEISEFGRERIKFFK